ncbi:hypothetical protein HUJ05_001628 [Dendroctonus ponderosae]|nr:hypothetical protein HUJ05_001628 [Dendroctonus ponderosae]
MVSAVFLHRRKYIKIYFSLNRLENVLSKEFEARCTCRCHKKLIPGLTFCCLIDLIDFFHRLDLQALSKSGQHILLDLTLIQRWILLSHFEELCKLLIENYSASLSHPRGKANYFHMGFFMRTYEELYDIVSNIRAFFYVQIGLIYIPILYGFITKAVTVYQELVGRGQSVSVLKETVFLLKSLLLFSTSLISFNSAENQLNQMEPINYSVWLSYPLDARTGFEERDETNSLEGNLKPRENFCECLQIDLIRLRFLIRNIQAAIVFKRTGKRESTRSIVQAAFAMPGRRKTTNTKRATSNYSTTKCKTRSPKANNAKTSTSKAKPWYFEAPTRSSKANNTKTDTSETKTRSSEANYAQTCTSKAKTRSCEAKARSSKAHYT